MTNASSNRWDHYYTPATAAEAIELLQRYEGRARVVGGGTDLLVETRRGLHRPVEAMVDVTHIEGKDFLTHVLGKGNAGREDTSVDELGRTLPMDEVKIGKPALRSE